LICVDYEWVFDFPVPIDFSVWYMINEFCHCYGAYFNKKEITKKICSEVGIDVKNLDIFEKMDRVFSENVFGKNSSENYLLRYRQPMLTQNMEMRV